MSLTLSIGISVFPENGLTAEDLLRHADAAMYTVKDSGRNSFRIFDESLETNRDTKRTSTELITQYNDASTHEEAQAEIYH
jgi:predicted signal transduction protein with EAL and GGDEF domain